MTTSPKTTTAAAAPATEPPQRGRCRQCGAPVTYRGVGPYPKTCDACDPAGARQRATWRTWSDRRKAKAAGERAP